ncbi:unnamed protein product [Cercopithifilaria johnstoni]|uniref:Uncharacterized protein n=1 Tax=Cercopithifilaria johnstoni TaxID=2874296 RepID=A0A8J2LZC7_9BILA|nr:unnamed protein product [Cercopithifilaria johnstoni]
MDFCLLLFIVIDFNISGISPLISLSAYYSRKLWLVVLSAASTFERACVTVTMSRLTAPRSNFLSAPCGAFKNCLRHPFFRSRGGQLGESFQPAINAPRLSLIGHVIATAQS